MSHVARLAAMSAAALLLAGCGSQSTLDRKALAQEAKTLQALAAEGGVLAGDSARGDSTSIFTRVHAGSLRSAAESSASTLARGRTPAARRLAGLAGRITRDLERLSGSGSERDLQRRLAHALNAAADAAAKAGGG
jgi:hypothetical protein